MREIKFRAWDTHRKKMWSAEELGEDELTLNPDGRGFVNVSGTSKRLSTYMNHMIPLEYTGLKDKNGVEIYEGDIITKKGTHDCASSLFYNDKNKKDFISVVKWMFDMWYCDYGNYHNNNPVCQLGGADKTNEDIEVIGNIYENPELVRSK